MISQNIIKAKYNYEHEAWNQFWIWSNLVLLT